MTLNDLSIQHKLLIGNGLSAATLVVLCAVVWNSLNTLNATAERVEHTYEVIDNAEGLVSSMVDQETGLRGFSVAGQDDYLEPYYAGLESFQQNLSTVKSLTSDNPAQQKRFDAIDADAKAWQAYAEGMITLRKDIRQGEDTNKKLAALIASGVGKSRMDGLRNEIAGGDFGPDGSDILSAMINMETGLRGFMLNKEEAFLDPYLKGQAAAANVLPFVKGTQLAKEAEGWIYDYAEKAIALVREANQYKTMDNLYADFAKKTGKVYMDGLRGKVAEVVGIEAELMGQRHASAAAASSLAISVILIGGLLTIVISFGFGMLISRSITQPISVAVNAAQRISKGDLRVEVAKGGSNEVGQLLNSLRATVESLRSIIGNMGDASESLNGASSNMSSMTRNTQEGANEQLKLTDEVASTMEQMVGAVQEVATNASNAAEAASDADAEAKTGLEVVQSTIDSINELEGEITQTASRLGELATEADNIGGILDVIRGIADQTNLLALNAAIEAARAGEQGRGFAVVADEVRSLAQRTQESTQEIQSLIESLQQGTREAVTTMDKSRSIVDSSVANASKSGDVLGNIFEAIVKINTMNTQIASAAEEQSATADHINVNVSNVNKISQESAVNAEQTVLSSEQMADLANTLGDIVKKFKV